MYNEITISAMALTKTINPQDYYSYKDWGQKLYDITNTAIDASPLGGSGGFGGFGGSQGGGGGFGGMFKSMFGFGGGTTGSAAGGAKSFKTGGTMGSLGDFGNMSTWLNYGRNTNQMPQYGAMGQMFKYQNGDWLGGGLGMQKYSNAWGSQGINMASGNKKGSNALGSQGINMASGNGGANGGVAGNNSFKAVANAGTGNDKVDIGLNAMGDIQNTWMSNPSDTWGNIGKTINTHNQAIVKIVGNQFKDPGQRIAYGDSTYTAPSRRDIERKTNSYVNDLKNTSFYSNANTMRDLADEVSRGGIYTDVSKDITAKQKWLSVGQRSLNASGKGAEIGSKIGGQWGTIIGGVAGGIAGIFGGAFGARRARRRLRKIQEAQRFANMVRDRQVQDAAANIGRQDVNRMMATQLAKGGRIERLINGSRFDGISRTSKVGKCFVSPFLE